MLWRQKMTREQERFDAANLDHLTRNGFVHQGDGIWVQTEPTRRKWWRARS